MSWKSRYKNVYKTSNPRLVITAVSSFPNIYDTVEKCIEYYRVKELQKDPNLLFIESLYELFHGRDFIPLYFEDDCPKLKKLRTDHLSKGMFWCVGYVNSSLTKSTEYSSTITTPSHTKYLELLKYSLDFLDGYLWEFLFEECVQKYVYEKTKDWTDLQKSRKFQLICNSNLIFLRHTAEYHPDKSKCLEFIEGLYERNIYEIMVNEYQSTLR